jgi:hypothetical protein
MMQNKAINNLAHPPHCTNKHIPNGTINIALASIRIRNLDIYNNILRIGHSLLQQAKPGKG